MKVQIHDTLTHLGMVDGEPVQSALYWADRVATGLESSKKYDRIRRQLREIIWDHFRVIGSNRHAVTPKGINALVSWAVSNINVDTMSEKHLVDGRQLAEAVRRLNLVINPAAISAAA